MYQNDNPHMQVAEQEEILYSVDLSDIKTGLCNPLLFNYEVEYK